MCVKVGLSVARDLEGCMKKKIFGERGGSGGNKENPSTISSHRLWYIYILDVDNKGVKSKFYGKDHIFYVGMSSDIGRRIGDHLNRRGDNAFLQKYFRFARRVPVFVRYVFGSKNYALLVEKNIKRLSIARKRKLIGGDDNCLFQYVPLKALVLYKFRDFYEKVAIRIR